MMMLSRIQQSFPWLALSFLLFLLGAGVHIWAGKAAQGVLSIHATGTDDAYISFRYAENLVQGHGLVFNAGEFVEGYSNFLFVLLAAALLQVVERETLYLAVSVFSLATFLPALMLFHRHALKHFGQRIAGFAVVLLATAPALWAWTASGLETIPMLSLQIALWLFTEDLLQRPTRKRVFAFGLTCTLILLMRVDGFVLPLIVVVYLALRRRVHLVGLTLACTVPTVVLLFLVRFLYYGWWLPNTYYNKVGASPVDRIPRGLEQLADLAISQGLLGYILGILAWLLLSLRSRSSEGLPLGSFLPLSFLAYWLYVGGDHFGERFLLILFPTGILAAFECGRTVLRSWGGTTIFLGLLLIQVFTFTTDSRFQYSAPRYDGWVTLGKYLGHHFPNRLLAVDAAGKVPFYSGLETIDMRGLTDLHIGHLEVDRFKNPGHDKSDLGYVLGREPDLIVALVGKNLDLDLDLDRATWKKAGYRLRLLANTSLRSRQGGDIFDVAKWTEAKQQELIGEGYHLAVLEKIATA